jgi:hypothetical protein
MRPILIYYEDNCKRQVRDSRAGGSLAVTEVSLKIAIFDQTSIATVIFRMTSARNIRSWPHGLFLMLRTHQKAENKAR